MIPIFHRVNTIEKLQKIPTNAGVEIDLRSNQRELILSHDPSDSGENFKDFLKEFQHQLLVVNIKEAGIEKKVMEALEENKIVDYFLLDIENPFLIQNYKKYGKHLSLRFSKFESVETINNFKKTVDWLWIDTYDDFEITKESSDIIRNFKTCLVSPSRWGNSFTIEYFIEKFREFNISIDFVMIEDHEYESIC